MKSSLRMLRTVHLAMLAALVMYVYLPEWLHPHSAATLNRVFFNAIAILAMTEAVIIFVIRRKFILRSEVTLAQDSENKPTLARWRFGYVLVFMFCLAVGLHGFVLRFIGFTLQQVIPFYLSSIALMLYNFPRDPSGKAIKNDISTT